jgi:hypothetical protein
MHLNQRGSFYATGADRRQRIFAFVPTRGAGWASQGVAFVADQQALAALAAQRL